MYTVKPDIFYDLIFKLENEDLVTDVVEDDDKIVLRVMTKDDNTKYQYFFTVSKKVNQHLIPLRIDDEGGTIFDGFFSQ